MYLTRGRKKAKIRRIDAAIAALTPLGFEKKVIRDTVRGLIKEYGDNDAGWYFLEEDYYKLVIETMVREQDGREQEKSIAAHEEQDVVNEERNEEDEASEEAKAIENAALALCEVSSSSNRGFSSIGGSSVDDSALRHLADCCDIIHSIELGLVRSSSVPKRKQSYGWLSEEEEEEEKEEKEEKEEEEKEEEEVKKEED